MIAGIEIFLGVDGKQVGMEMTEYQMACWIYCLLHVLDSLVANVLDW